MRLNHRVTYTKTLSLWIKPARSIIIATPVLDAAHSFYSPWKMSALAVHKVALDHEQEYR